MTDDAAPGHDADWPHHIPWHGWKALLVRTWKQAGKDHVGLVAAGIAFYGLLALFPAITALIAIGGLVFDPHQITSEMSVISSVVPPEAARIILDQAMSVAGSYHGGLGFAAIFGLLLAFWSASRGVASLVEGVNIAYDEKETRGILLRTAIRLALTLFLIVGMIAGLAVTIVIPSVLSFVHLGPVTEMLVAALRWGVLVMMTIVGISVVYRYAPNRTKAKWRWLTPGAAMATVLWIAASVAFALYAQHFGSYQKSFGTLAGVIILLMWLWLSSYVLLLGAELDAEAEAQTRADTTVGPRKPLGERGAKKADTAPD